MDLHNGIKHTSAIICECHLIVFVEILDDLGDHVERTNVRVRTETENVTVVDSKDKTCIYWVVIILLFISIIIVVAL